MGGHFTFGKASPPLGAFDEFFRWFPALKRRAGLTSPPLGFFANDDHGDRRGTQATGLFITHNVGSANILTPSTLWVMSRFSFFG